MKYETLIDEARAARELAYVPYSRFKVGAALETKDGRVFRGCNVENASYGLCNCAERTAFFSAIAHGYVPGDFAALAVIGDTDGPIAPCGACRQVILELGGNDLAVVLANLKGDVMETTAAAQLPNAFGGRDLQKS
ncbi:MULTISPECIES: cytidine deaminase [Massilia]|jgi:cytidine deaminase|uniref:Cytidine deaminase n=2 Tax=Massilia TaxID=149698 RepID=A0A7X3G1H7_9BURK|nr:MULTISPECIES: cytidine deaminase [Telluria group]KQY18896.1 cytidine deaminase [Massilia sp. Root133]KQZ53551.1 cytidine deaminase [Massilia sp. Root1485]MDN4041379.1 cytidine deaminase [Massilia sp. YIM B02787]MVW61735.1 cytidine deaminase [Telluria cellulosilytica]